MNIRKNGEWYPFAVHLVKNRFMDRGLFNEVKSSLQDFGGNLKERSSTIHGAWYKKVGSNIWEKVTKIKSEFALDDRNVFSGNECALIMRNNSEHDTVFMKTGGDPMGNGQVFESGEVNFLDINGFNNLRYKYMLRK